MPETAVVREHLDRLVEELLDKGISSAWVGLELLTVGVGLLTRIVGKRQMAEHLRDIAERLEAGKESDAPGISAHG